MSFGRLTDQFCRQRAYTCTMILEKQTADNLSILARRQKIRYFILFEAVTFSLAALIHRGILITGYMHHQAAIAESVIAAVLVGGLLLGWIRPAWTRISGLLVQGIAMFGTCVGILTIIVGVGPRTAPDLTYHALILIVLGWGIVFAKKTGK